MELAARKANAASGSSRAVIGTGSTALPRSGVRGDAQDPNSQGAQYGDLDALIEAMAPPCETRPSTYSSQTERLRDVFQARRDHGGVGWNEVTSTSRMPRKCRSQIA